MLEQKGTPRTHERVRFARCVLRPGSRFSVCVFSEGTNFNGSIIKVKNDNGLNKLPAKIMRERTNLIGVTGCNAAEEDKQRIEEMALETEGAAE